MPPVAEKTLSVKKMIRGIGWVGVKGWGLRVKGWWSVVYRL